MHVAAATVGLSALIASSASAFTRRQARRRGVPDRGRHPAHPHARRAGDDGRGRAGAATPALRAGRRRQRPQPEDRAVLPGVPAAVRRPRAVGRARRSRSSACCSSAIALLSDLAYALLADALAGRVRRSGRAARVRRFATGGIFVALGVTAAAAHRELMPRDPAARGLAHRRRRRRPTTTSSSARPAAREALEDVPAAVASALAFPLAGEPLEKLVTRGGTATVVIEQPSLPIPAATLGPRAHRDRGGRRTSSSGSASRR